MNGLATFAADVKQDAGYAWAVFCNIAMPIMDAIPGTSHQQANEAAAHLMQHMLEYDITTHPQYEYGKSGAQSYAEMRIAADKAEDATPATPATSAGEQS